MLKKLSNLLMLFECRASNRLIYSKCCFKGKQRCPEIFSWVAATNVLKLLPLSCSHCSILVSWILTGLRLSAVARTTSGFLVAIFWRSAREWYTGQVFVGLKYAAFEQSSPICHMAELCEILKMMFLLHQSFSYTQMGGPTTALHFSDDPAISSGILTCGRTALTCGRTEGLTLYQYDWKIPML